MAERGFPALPGSLESSVFDAGKTSAM